MKKIIMVLVSGVFYTSLITGNATAQKVSDISFAAPKIDYKIDSIGGDNEAAANAIDPANKIALKGMKASLKEAKFNFKVTNHIYSNFKNISNLLLSSADNLTIAKFKMNDKSAYDKKGNWSYTMITYHEDQMPQNIKSLIKDNYKGFTISLIHEIRQQEITCYMVYLEDETSFKHVLIYNNEIIKDEIFHKSL